MDKEPIPKGFSNVRVNEINCNNKLTDKQKDLRYNIISAIISIWLINLIEGVCHG